MFSVKIKEQIICCSKEQHNTRSMFQVLNKVNIHKIKVLSLLYKKITKARLILMFSSFKSY